MREFPESHVLGSNVALERCRCLPPLVKVHHFDCPLVKKQPCPVHGDNHRPENTDSCMVITFHPNVKSEGLVHPVPMLVTNGQNCCSATKPKDIIFPSNRHSFDSRDRTKNQQVQTNLEKVKKSRFYFDNTSYQKGVKPIPPDKTNHLKKLNKCFHSPCDSLAHTSTTAKVKTKNTLGLHSNPVDDHSHNLEDSDSKQSLDCYYFGPLRNDLPEKNTTILPNAGNKCYFINNDACNLKEISLTRPYFVYSTLNTANPSKTTGPPTRKTRYKFEEEEYVSVEHKDTFVSDDQDKRNEELKDQKNDSSSDDEAQSDSSGSFYYTPFILQPDDYEKYARNQNPMVNQEVQISPRDLSLEKQRPSLCSIATSAIYPATEDRSIKVADTPPGPDTKKPDDTPVNMHQGSTLLISDPATSAPPFVSLSSAPKNRPPVSSPSTLSTAHMSPAPEIEAGHFSKPTSNIKKNNHHEKTYKTGPESGLRVVPGPPDNEVIMLKEKKVVQLGPSDSNDIRSVKLQTFMNLSQHTSSERTIVAPTNRAIEQNFENPQIISLKKNDLSLDVTEVENKPQTSLKLNQTSISITTRVSQPSYSYSTTTDLDQSANSASTTSNDTYTIKDFPSIESNPSAEKELHKRLHKSISDSKLYKETKSPKSTNQKTIKEDEECLCDDSCDHPIGSVVIDQSANHESTRTPPPNAPTALPPRTSTRKTHSPPQITTFSNLTELKKIIDQGFHRMANQMKNMCDCKQRQAPKQVVEREVMTDTLDYSQIHPTSKKEIHYAQASSVTRHLTTNETDGKPLALKSCVLVNIPHTNPMDLVCKLCANYIRTFTMDATTNTDLPKTSLKEVNKPREPPFIEVTSSTIFKKLVKKNPQLSINLPTSQKQQIQRPWLPPSPEYRPKITPPSNQKSGSSTPKSTNNPCERKRIPNPHETIRITTPDPSIKSNNSGGQPRGSRPKSNVAPAQKSIAPTRNFPSSPAQKPSTRQTNRKNSNNFITFPLRISPFGLNEYFRYLHEEAIKRCQTKCKQNTPPIRENQPKTPQNITPKILQNSDTDDFGMNESILLRPTKSDSCSCQYTSRTIGSTPPKKTKELKCPAIACLQPDSGSSTPRDAVRCPYEKAIKSEEALKRRPRKNTTENTREYNSRPEDTERSDNPVGDTYRRSPDNPGFNYHGKLAKCFLDELFGCPDSEVHSLNFKERVLRSFLFSDHPFSNDDDSSPQEFTDEEEECYHREEVEEELSEKEESNLEEEEEEEVEDYDDNNDEN